MELQLIARLWRVLSHDQDSSMRVSQLRRVTRIGLVWLAVDELLFLLQLYPYKMLIELVNAPSGQHFSFNLDKQGYFYLVLVTYSLVFGLEKYANYRMGLERNTAAWMFFFTLELFGEYHQLRLGIDWHVANSSGSKESVFAKNLKKVDIMVDNAIYDILPLSVQLVLVVPAAFVIHWQFGLLALGTLVCYLLLARYTEHKQGPLRKEYREYTRRIDVSASTLNNTAIVLKEMGLEDEFLAAHIALTDEHLAKEIPRNRIFRRRIWAQDNVMVGSRLIFAAVAFFGSLHGMVLGKVILAGGWLDRIYSNAYRFGNFQHILNEGVEALREMVELFETKPTLIEPSHPEWPLKPQGAIELSAVSFTYPGQLVPAVRNIDLSIKPGETIALVGESGSGKTTLARLIQRQYDPSDGVITVDDVNLRLYDSRRYRREMIGVVSQDPGLFDESVRRNISRGRPDASFAEILAAAEQAAALEFIESLSAGFDTIVGERGVRLSGGQKQRLVIGRALLTKPSILIFDEPTSSLDGLSQEVVTRTLKKIAELSHTTVIIIAHRFSTIAPADKVVVLDRGCIIEVGTHEELERLGGRYAELRRLEGVTQ